MACSVCPTCNRRIPGKTSNGPRKPGKIAWKNAKTRHNGQGCKQCGSLECVPRHFDRPEGFMPAGIDSTGYCLRCREALAVSAMHWVNNGDFPFGAWPADLSETDCQGILEEFSAACH